MVETVTLQDMRERISDDLDRTDLDTQIDHFINRAVDFYKSESFWFMEGDTSFVTSIGIQEYSGSLPDDIETIQYLKITVNGHSYEVLPRTMAQIQDMDSIPTNDRPQYYARNEDKIIFDCPAAGNYICKLYYRRSSAPLVDDADDNAFSNYARDLIEAHTKEQVLRRVIKDTNEADQELAMVTRFYNNIKSISDRKRQTNTNKPTQF